MESNENDRSNNTPILLENLQKFMNRGNYQNESVLKPEERSRMQIYNDISPKP